MDEKEVKEETKTVEEPTKIEKVPQEPVKVENKQKDTKTILLVVLFVGLFALIMGMPYVNDFLDNLRKNAGMDPIEQRAKQIENQQNAINNKNKNNTTEKKEDLKTLTCTKPAQAVANYDLIIKEAFEYNSKGEVKKSTKTTTYKFAEKNESYTTLATECNDNALKYVKNPGYETACLTEENEISISETFDLETFKTIKDENTVIEANTKLNEKIDNIKKKLTAKEYVCE